MSHIKVTFPERACFCFPLPVSDFARLGHLQYVPDNDVDTGFLSVSNAFCDHIYSTSNPIWINKSKGVAFTGSGKNIYKYSNIN